MSRLVWLAGLSGVAAVALLIAFRGQAVASDFAGCAPTDSFVPAFCVNVPTSSARRDTSVPLVALPSARADVRVEVGVSGPDAAALAVGVDRSVARVETLFGRTFSARPRVLVFGGADSFARGAADLFGYTRQTAEYVANTYGGVFDRPTLTIAVNWRAAGATRMNAAIAHELTHLMIREIAATNTVPAWLDEGLATIVEQESPEAASWNAEEELVGRAVAASGAIALTQLESASDFHAAYARMDRPLYAFAAGAVRAMVSRVGWDGLLRVLAAIRTEQDIASAYGRVAGESLNRLERRLADSAAPGIVSTGTPDAGGNVSWTLYAGRASAEVLVRISGAKGYAVTFTVRTDAFGMYRGSFGSTASAGTYTISAAGAVATIVSGR